MFRQYRKFSANRSIHDSSTPSRKMRVPNFFATLALVSILWSASESANILGVFPFKFKSHFIVYDALMVELALRGHNVTVVSPFPKSKPLTNFRDIDVDRCNRMSMDIYVLDEAYKSHESFYQIDVLFSLAQLDESILACPPVQQLLASSDTYDLVIAEVFCSDMMLAFAERFHAPHVSFCPAQLFPWAAERSGTPDNPSYISYPHSNMPLDRGASTFYQRLYNTAVYVYAKSMFYLTNRNQELMKQKYFGFVKPSLEEMAKNTSLTLTFSHFSITTPQPLAPNVVEVGGLQVIPASALPKVPCFLSNARL